MNGKNILLCSGREEGYYWRLRQYVGRTGKIGKETFDVKNHAAKYRWKENKVVREDRHRIRSIDNSFFRRMLPKEMMDKYEVHHIWDSPDGIIWTFLITPEEHRNTKKGKTNQRNWMEEEEWL